MYLMLFRYLKPQTPSISVHVILSYQKTQKIPFLPIQEPLKIKVAFSRIFSMLLTSLFTLQNYFAKYPKLATLIK